MLNKGEYLRQRDVYYISGNQVLQGKVASLVPKDPEYIRIRKHGLVRLDEVYLDKPTAYVAQNIALRKQQELISAMLKANEANMRDYE